MRQLPSPALLALLALLALFAGRALARTDVMVPLYVYPGNSTWTNPDWQAAVDAIKAHPELHFYVVINPNNGPQNTSDPSGFNGGYCNVASDPNYIPHGCNRDWTTHLAALAALDNAQTLGYVWTRYGARPAADVRADVAEWARWDEAPTWTAGETADIRVHGLWFDELGTGAGNASSYLDLVRYANQTFASGTGDGGDGDDDGGDRDRDRGRYTVVLNAGPVPDAAYEAQLFSMASAVVTKETCYTSDPAASGAAWDCPAPYAPFSLGSLAGGDGLPRDDRLRPRAVVLVHQFVGPPAATAATLRDQVAGVAALGVHSTYFTSGSWHNTTVAPATIGAVAEMLSVANDAAAAAAAAVVSGGAWGLVAWVPWVCALLYLHL